MTRRVIMAAAVLALCAGAQADEWSQMIGQADQVTRGLVAYYSMRNSGTTVFDEWGGNNATNVRSAVISYENGAVGNGALFANTNYIATASRQWGLSSAYSISAWVNAPSGSTVRQIVSSDSATHPSLFQFRIDATNNARFLTFNSNSNAINNFAGSAVVANDKWNHLVCTFSSTSGAAMYLNGQLYAISTNQGVGINDSYPVYIGSRNADGEPDFFVGKIDEVKFFSGETLGITEIRQLYRMGATPRRIKE
jgi:hypothetical protein